MARAMVWLGAGVVGLGLIVLLLVPAALRLSALLLPLAAAVISAVLLTVPALLRRRRPERQERP